ncbi:divalent-cation tolerance protein CutA [Nitrososphaera sp.]|uniref:divalent-cation tolerance protein CutA n=1 Tax=Nitrososphaera sp. TaxID=1971748 RepID=UPI00307E40AF
MGKAKAVIVISTFSGEAPASDIGRRMVEKGLCACVNLAPVRSIYAWKGRVEDQEEYIAFFKTTKESAAELKKELARAHPYEVPEIVEIKMSDVSRPYLSWLASSAQRVAKKRNHAAKR